MIAVLVLGVHPVVATGEPSAGWSIQPSPNPPDANQSELSAVACAKGGTCMAVGWYATLQEERSTLAERWDGSTWSIEPTPNPAGALGTWLDGVACPSSNDCEAVGTSLLSDRTIGVVERWNGSTWSIVPTPRPHSADVAFNGVSCLNPKDCTAVGGFRKWDAAYQTRQQPLAERWDGTTWRIETTPDPQAPDGSSLDGVACTASASCEAVGTYSYAGMPFRDSVFAMGWNGRKWGLQDQPNPGQLPKVYEFAVACSEPDACTSVGTWNDTGRYHALAERWDGTSWSRQRAPNWPDFQSSELNDVSCPGGSTCIAVGDWAKSKYGRGGGILVERWAGEGWTLESPPAPPDGKGALRGVVCGSPTACVAVGTGSLPGGSGTLVEVYSG
jgi:hypothetical protein